MLPGVHFNKLSIFVYNIYRYMPNSYIYRKAHEMVRKIKGKAKVCNICRKEGIGHQIQWANIYHIVTFNIEHYVEMCGKCHYIFDQEFIINNQKKGIFNCRDTNRVFI